MLIECILISSSLCQSVKAKPAKPVLERKQNAIVAVLNDRPVMTLMAVDVVAKTMDYRQTQRDFLLGGFQEHNAMLRPMLGHPAAMYAYGTMAADGIGTPVDIAEAYRWFTLASWRGSSEFLPNGLSDGISDELFEQLLEGLHGPSLDPRSGAEGMGEAALIG